MDSGVTGSTNAPNARENGYLLIVVKLPDLMGVEVAAIGRCRATVATSRFGIFKGLLPDGSPDPSL